VEIAARRRPGGEGFVFEWKLPRGGGLGVKGCFDNILNSFIICILFSTRNNADIISEIL
jgi:hypothetical protein